MNKLISTSILVPLSLLCSYSGYSQTTLYSELEPTVFKGSTFVEQVYSPALEGNLQGNGSTQPVKVYLPPGYNDYPDNEYPVIYLLHGYLGDYNFFYRQNDLFEKMNRMISQKIIVPMIIVTPNGSTKYNGCWYTNSYVTGNWADYIVHDVIQSIESKYQVLNNVESRGLAGYSMGGYGTVKIAMRHPSKFNSISLIGGAWLDQELIFSNPPYREHMLSAAKKNIFISNDPWQTRVMFASAVAFAPDSTAASFPGRLPYDADGMLIDSIWQKWLLHDPFTMLQTYKDSLLKLNAIQMYIGGRDDLLPSNETFHQALLDNGIDHGYEIFSGGHTAGYLIDNFSFFSKHLVGVVPTVSLSSAYYLENTENLVAEMDMDGELYIVPSSAGNGLDSIDKYQVATADALANEENEFPLSEFEFGKYHVFAVSSDSAVSNLHGEFTVVPDKLPPDLVLTSGTVDLEDPIQVSISRDGKICLHYPSLLHLDTLQTASEIMNSPRLIESANALADAEVIFSTDDLQEGEYWIYGFDQYGIVAGPKSIEVVEITDILAKPMPKIELFPNPVSGIVTIQTNRYDLYDLSITSINGQLLLRKDFEGTNHELDLSFFKKGVYFITIRSKDFVATEKIIKLL